MINLILPKNKEQLKAEYRLRIVSVWLTLWGIAFLLATVFMVPVYLLVSERLDTLIDLPLEEVADRKGLESSEAEVNLLAAKLIGTDYKPTVQEAIEILRSVASSEIKINTFIFDGQMISLKGVVSGQSHLDDFRQLATAHEFFELVGFSQIKPDSESMIEFTMRLILKSV